MKKSVPVFLRVFLIIMVLSLIAMAVYWVPFAVKYVNETLTRYTSIGSIPAALVPSIVVLAYTVCAVAMAVIVIAFYFPRAIERDRIFSVGTARVIGTVAALILVDVVLVCVGGLCMAFCAEYLLSPMLLFVSLIGAALSAMLFILSKYVRDASELKEEVALTL